MTEQIAVSGIAFSCIALHRKGSRRVVRRVMAIGVYRMLFNCVSTCHVKYCS